jgi:hypothetical protein
MAEHHRDRSDGNVLIRKVAWEIMFGINRRESPVANLTADGGVGRLASRIVTSGRALTGIVDSSP